MNDSQFFVFTTKLSSSFKAFLYVGALLGLYFSIYNLVLGLTICLICIFFLITKQGILVDLVNKKYKRARLFKNSSVLPWKNLPNITYISIFKASMVSRAYSMGGVCVELQKKVILINLIYNKKQKINIYQTLDSEDALYKAKIIAAKIHVPIYDATLNSGTWIK